MAYYSTLQSNEMPGYGVADMKDTVLYSGPGHFDQSRLVLLYIFES